MYSLQKSIRTFYDITSQTLKVQKYAYVFGSILNYKFNLYFFNIQITVFFLVIYGSPTKCIFDLILKHDLQSSAKECDII